MPWRHGECKCCGEGCELVSTRANCNDEDGLPLCQPGGVVPGCGPISVTFTVPDTAGGRETIANLNLYEQETQKFRWAGGTTLGVQVNEWATTCDGDDFRFYSLLIYYGCQEETVPVGDPDVITNSRYAEITLPEGCSNCKLFIIANYQICQPVLNCGDCVPDYSVPSFPMTAINQSPMTFNNPHLFESSQGQPRFECDHVLLPDATNYDRCGPPPLHEPTGDDLALLEGRTRVDLIEEARVDFLNNIGASTPLRMLCTDFSMILIDPIDSDDVVFSGKLGITRDFNYMLQGSQICNTARFGWGYDYYYAVQLFYDTAQALSGNLVGYIEAAGRLGVSWGEFASGTPGLDYLPCFYRAYRGRFTTTRYPSSGTKLFGTFAPIDGNNCVSPNLCDAIFDALIDEGPYTSPDVGGDGACGPLTFRLT